MQNAILGQYPTMKHSKWAGWVSLLDASDNADTNIVVNSIQCNKNSAILKTTFRHYRLREDFTLNKD